MYTIEALDSIGKWLALPNCSYADLSHATAVMRKLAGQGWTNLRIVSKDGTSLYL